MDFGAAGQEKRRDEGRGEKKRGDGAMPSVRSPRRAVVSLLILVACG